MSEIKRSDHWGFAIVCALLELEKLVWSFDYKRYVKKAAYTEQTPARLLKIIDGFLAEKQMLYGGEKGRLEKMRTYITTELSHIYNLGAQNATSIWQAASDDDKAHLETWDEQKVYETAHEAISKDYDESRQSWFIAGFTLEWSKQWLEYFRLKHQSDE